ncbi:uncharacterized protein LOC132192593 isoform X2 [Neocloeon triangulifer]|uniref:uncharacterized protein LOC132192593 isoform X2 n=1 Tax=Neocloeon triangulifer TaxID=2078957 RepID=UPI00286F2B18|nr:uncharacterized protein LOC132192593 isoform X2 [Neocloeon triangulifer]
MSSQMSTTNGTASLANEDRTKEAIRNWTTQYRLAGQLELAIKMWSSETCDLTRANFKILRQLITKGDTNYILQTLAPFIEKLAKNISPVDEYLFAGKEATVTLSKIRIAEILANGFFCTFDDKIATCRDFPPINFSNLYIDSSTAWFDAKLEKLKCLIEYFKQVSVQQDELNEDHVSFQRICVTESLDWLNSTLPLSEFNINNSDSMYECPDNMAQVNFADCNIGGGTLKDNCCQEEIKFITCPELIAARLLCQEMKSNEAIVISGALPYSKHSGYASLFKFAGPADQNANRSSTLIAINATDFSSGDPHRQFTKKSIDKELLKAYAGFSKCPLDTIATGNWGGGNLKGDSELKMQIQWLAASMAKKKLVYYCNGEQKLIDSCLNLKKEKSTNIGQHYTVILCRYDEDF